MSNITMKQKIVAVYNADRTALGEPTIVEADFVFGAPSDYNGPQSPADTRLYLTPLAASSSTGRITLYYDRLVLDDIISLAIEKGTAVMVSDILDQINDELGIVLQTSDIVDAALPTVGPFTLTASATNLLYKGSTSVAYIV